MAGVADGRGRQGSSQTASRQETGLARALAVETEEGSLGEAELQDLSFSGRVATGQQLRGLGNLNLRNHWPLRRGGGHEMLPSLG